MDLSVIGLGKVGLSLAACLVGAGHKTVGVDLDQSLVDGLNRGEFSHAEPGVMERLGRRWTDRFRATTATGDAVRHTQVTFVIVPTPSNTLGGFSVRHVVRACDAIGDALRDKPGTHTVAIVSTLLPGSSDAIVIPRLEQASGRKIGAGLGYCYNPSFIALGEVVNGIERPDYLLIGEADQASGDVVNSIHQSIVTEPSPVARMSPIEAEIAKIASNTHETMRVSFANMLLSVCSEVPGADVDRITEALAHRMGRRFFKGATPYGGPCWPRDNQALSVFIDALGATATLPRAVDAFNGEHARYVLRKMMALTAPGDIVGLMGLAYKPGTSVIERAFALDLAGWLVHEGRRVIGWDPLAIPEARRVLGDRIQYASTPEECLRVSSTAIVTIPLAELASVDWSASTGTQLVDCWRCLPAVATEACRRYVALGRGPASDVASWLERLAGDEFHLLTS